MAITVYWISGSPFAWRVLLALEFKRLAYDSRLLSVQKGDLASPDYLSINPRGKVPALTDGDYTLYESVAIMSYLERKHPEPALFGRTPQEHGLVMRWLSEIAAYIETEGIAIPRTIFFADWNDAARETIARQVDRLLPELQRIEGQLARGAWLCGAQCTAADIALYPLLQIFWRASLVAERKGGHPALARIAAGNFPSIANWCKAVESLPGYERSYPPHWREQ